MSNWLKQIKKLNKRLDEFTTRGEDGVIRELPIDGADTKDWTYIGEIIFGGSDCRKDNKRKYLLVYPNYTPSDINKGSSFIERNISVNEDPNGSDGGHYFYSDFDSRFDKIKLNDGFKESEYALLFKRYLDDSDNATQKIREQKHQEFMSKLFIIGDNIIMHHNSTAKITDGYLRAGMPKRSYSNNNDWGIYMWASKNSGQDQSNTSDYTYYCVVPLEKCYDVHNNVENFKTDKEVLSKYPYMLKDWKNGQAVACQTNKPTRIWRIMQHNPVKWFDDEWNEVETPSIFQN